MPVVAPVLEQNGYTVLHQFWPRSHIKEREQNKNAFPSQYGFSAGNYTNRHHQGRVLLAVKSPSNVPKWFR